ncbi:integrase domain-containing protein [Paraburkholderia sp.]|uniref:integrase domain-containing protein n=1 Tax=Paraburkholderia sp. TaxID=1926495 RepID=UPI003D6FC564
MGIKAKLVHEASIISRRAGGSIRNQTQRYKLASTFFDFLQKRQQLPRRIKEIDEKLLFPFVAMHLGKETGIGHLHNTLAAIRVILRHAGVDIEGVSNKELGVPHRSRIGKKRPYTADELKMLWPRARRKDTGFYHIVRLQYLLGLRSQEALMCGPNLGDWLERLQSQRTNALLPVTRGAKNGRYREISVLKERAEETRSAVSDAYTYCADRSFRFLCATGDLKKARMRLITLYRCTGMIGECSSHALRYTYACEKALELLDEGIDHQKTLRLLSSYLGHGDSRYLWIKSVYCRSIAHRFCAQGNNKSRSAQHQRTTASDPQNTTASTASTHTGHRIDLSYHHTAPN